MPVAWHPKRWRNVCMTEDEKKKWNQFLLGNALNVYSMEALGHFDR